MQKNESYITPVLPLLLFILLSLCNGIAQVAVDDVVTDYEQWVLKVIEYGIGISVVAAMLAGIVASVSERSVVYVLLTIIVILLVNMIMPFFVKYIFMAIIACVLTVVAMFFLGPITIFVAYLTGTLGTLITVLLFIAAIFSNSVVGGW